MTRGEPEPVSEDAESDVTAEAAPTPWWRKRRNVNIAAIILVAVIVVVNLGYQLVRTGPEQIVRDYLSAVRTGDVDTALGYVDGIWEFDEISKELLVAEAMTGDWKVTNVARRPGVNSVAAIVDFTITAADDTTRSGRFQLADNGSNWQILNPLAKIDISALPIGFAEFNGVVGEPTETRITDDSRTKTPKPAHQLWMFPGAYAPYADSADLVKPRMSSYIAVPSKYLTGEEVMLSVQTFAPELAPGEKFVEEANRQFTDWLDTCADSNWIAPKDCPFSAGAATGKGAVSLDPNQEFYTNKAAWRITAHPKIELMQADGKFLVREVEPGTVDVSGEGTLTPDGDTAPVGFSGECTIDLASVTVKLTEPGKLAFEAKRAGSRCDRTYG